MYTFNIHSATFISSYSQNNHAGVQAFKGLLALALIANETSSSLHTIFVHTMFSVLVSPFDTQLSHLNL